MRGEAGGGALSETDAEAPPPSCLCRVLPLREAPPSPLLPVLLPAFCAFSCSSRRAVDARVAQCPRAESKYSFFYLLSSSSPSLTQMHQNATSNTAVPPDRSLRAMHKVHVGLVRTQPGA